MHITWQARPASVHPGRVAAAALCALTLTLFLITLPDPATAAVKCSEAEAVCKDRLLSDVNKAISRRERILAGAAMHPALRGEIGQSDEDWREGLAECATTKDSKSCYRTKLRQRLGVMTLLNRIFAGPRLADDPARACAAQRREILKCADETFTAADTVYGIMARALATSLAAIDIQNTASPDGGSVAERAEDAFRSWRSAECQTLELSPLVEKRPGGAVSCEAALTWHETEELAGLLGRTAHWSEQIEEIAAGVRACLDRGRDEDVELRVIDVFNDDAVGRIIRLLGSRGRYDCVAAGNVAAEFSVVPAKTSRPGEGSAVFIPVQGLRSPQELLATMPDKGSDCYETSAVIQAGARLSGWIALSRCD
jgi:hypothetical protein